MMMAVSRRAVQSVPAQVARSARRSASDRTGVSGSPGAGVLTPAVASWSASLALQPAAEMPDPGEPSSGRVAGVVLPDLAQPAPDVLAIQLGRPDFRWCSASQPARLRTAFWYALTVFSA
jgi:hypothetical protein